MILFIVSLLLAASIVALFNSEPNKEYEGSYCFAVAALIIAEVITIVAFVHNWSQT